MNKATKTCCKLINADLVQPHVVFTNINKEKESLFLLFSLVEPYIGCVPLIVTPINKLQSPIFPKKKSQTPHLV